MKNYLLKQTKKGISIVLAALMLMTCWVFVAPDKAEAQNTGNYTWRFTWEDGKDNGMKNAALTVSVYGRANNGTGSESTINTTNISKESLNTKDEKTICSGTTSNGIFPCRFSVPDFRNENTSDSCTNYWRLYVNDKVVAEVSYGHGNSSGTSAQNITCADDNFPYLSNISWSASNTNTSRNATTANASIQVGTMTLKDQYGVNLYVNSLTSAANLNGANITTSITAKSDKDEIVGTGYCYASNNNNTGNVTNYINYKAFPTTNQATKYTVSNIGYSVSWRGYKKTATLSANWSGSLVVNNPYTDVTYNAQGNSGEPDNTMYGAASGTKNATIGSGSNLSTRVYYNWDMNQGDAPTDKDDTSDKYTKRDYYTFKYYTLGAASDTPAVYITHAGTAEDQGYAQTGHDGYLDNTIPYGDGIKMGSADSSVFPNGSTYANSKTYYGWWEPNHYTVTFLNADGNQLYKNEEQDADHYAYYGGAYPTYAQGNTFTYAFAGWVNLNTGELITGTNWGNPGLINNASLNQYVYEDVTYMAYYTAAKVDDGSGKSAYKVKFDYNGDGVINTGEGDNIDETDNAYYDKVYRSTNVPTLTGEIFDSRSFFNWVDAGITATRGTVEYNDNGLTVTSTGNDSYTSYSPAMEVSSGTYKFSFNVEDLLGNNFHGGNENTVQIFLFYYTDAAASGSYGSCESKNFSAPGTCTGTFTVPAGVSGLRIRFDANDAGNIVKFSDIRIWKEENTYTKPSTAEVDYSNPVWVNMYDGSRLLANTRMIEEIQSYKVKFDETPVTYSLTLITGSNNGNVQLQSGTNYYANANTGVKEENDAYTWADTITLPNPGNFADGVYDYQFTGWVDSNGVVRQAGYRLAKANGVNAADGIYSDEYVRSDGLNESTGLDTITYRARYTRTAKTYVVNFVDEKGVEISGSNWTGEYLSVLPVVSPADQTKVDTLEENNPLRYTYRFVGWDNTKTTAIENYTAAYLNNFYATNGITADATYKPVFESTYHYYVKYQNYNGTAIDWAPGWFTYGEVINANHLPENNGATIETPASNQVYTYTVEGWATSLGVQLTEGTTTVTSDITYVAQLKQTLQEYDVSFYGEDGTTLIGTVADVPYGSKPKDIGTVPTASKPQTEQMVYTFVGWDDMSTQSIIENTAAADLDVVHGDQSYRAVFREEKRGYAVSFMVPDSVSYVTTGNVAITANTYKDYAWTDSGINFGPSKLPAYYYGERVTAPSVAPTLTNPTVPTGYEVVFVGWFTGENGAGTQLGRATRIEGESSPTTYYAYFKYVGLQYSVQFFEGVGIVTPFATLTEVDYGTDATTAAADAAAQLEPYYDATNHYTFDKWVLRDGTTAAASSLSSVTEALKVYAVYTPAAHTFGDWEATTPATYYAAGVETRTCSVCGCKQTRPITRLEDNSAPIGQIIVKDTDGSYISKEFHETYNGTNTKYVKDNSVEVQINFSDIGLGVKNLYYAVLKDDAAKTLVYAQSFDWDTEEGVIKSDIRNAHFTIDGEDGSTYIVYVYALDNAVTWNAADVVNGEPTATTADPNKTYLSSYKIVFDIDSPEIAVTNSNNFNNADKTVFCNSADIAISDTYLDRVVITKDDAAFEDNTAIIGKTFTKSIAEAGVYVVTAYDITGKSATYTFTVQAGHDHDADNDGTDESFVYTDPTCTVNGFTTYTCVICGTQTVVEDDPITTLGHNYDQNGDGVVNDDDFVITTPVTCEFDGSKVKICVRCDYIDESSRTVIPAIGHNYKLTEDVASTCEVDGHKTYVCGNDATHTYTETFAALGHDFDINGDKVVDINDRDSHTAATCGVNAYDTYKCVRYDECGESYTVEYPNTALEHSYSESVLYAASCDHYGVMKHECDNCGDVYYTQIEMIAHDYAWKTITYPTCCTVGLERHICKLCGKVEDPAFPDGREMPMTEHEYGAWRVVTPAACGVTGLERRECKNFVACGAYEERDIAALAHNWVLTETVAATAEHGGYELWTCSLCGETKYENQTPALAAHVVNLYEADGTTLIGSIGTIGGDTLTQSKITISAPVIVGYTFSKWVNMDGSDIVWPVTVSGDISIKASYSINSYTVKWMVGDTEAEVDDVNYNTVPTYDSETPTKAIDVYYEYTFAGWSTDANADAADVLSAIPAATANAVYYAIFLKTGVLYTITWKSWDNTELITTQAAYNTMPEIPTVSVPDTQDDRASYTWDKGWTPEIRLVSGNATYTATYTATPKLATIYFFAEGADTSDTSNAVYSPVYAVDDTFVLPEGPSKAATAQHTYTFKEWVAVDGQTATAPGATIVASNNGYKYVATYDEHNIDYTVTFNNEDNTLVDSQTKLFGEAITAPAKPIKQVPVEDEGKYRYDFIGWKFRGTTYAADALPTVSGDMTFTAVFEQVYNDFDVTFKNWDGTETYSTGKMTYGDAISYNGATPYIARTAQYTYTWLGWANEANSSVKLDSLGTVAGDTVFYAAFTQTVRTYKITFNVDGTAIERTLDYGAAVAYPAGETDVPSLDKAATPYRTYTFAGWAKSADASPEDVAFTPDETLPTVSGNATYYAIYSSVINQVSATWNNFDDSKLSDKTDNYGFTPKYTGETPVKPTDDGVDGANYTYTFTGWVDQDAKAYAVDATFGRITKDMVYTAQFEKSFKNYTVTFKNADTVVVTKSDYKYGDILVLPEAPENYDKDSVHYIFAGWSVDGTTVVELTDATVTADVEYKAVFEKVAFDKFAITFDNEGSVFETVEVKTDEVVTPPAVNPTKASDAPGGDAEYTYVFAGWSKDNTEANIITDWSAVKATADVTYYAIYVKDVKEYSVTFRTEKIGNEGGNYISLVKGGYNATVTPPAAPEKAPTNTQKFVFQGWSADNGVTVSKDIPNITGNATYYAVYKSSTRYYSVRFVDWEGNEVASDSYEYGATLTSPAAPEKPEDAGHTYTFKGWSPALPTIVTKEATYTAQYNTVDKTFKVYFYDVNVDGSLKGTAYSYKEYTYNSDLVLPEDPSRLDTDEFDYTFVGWARTDDTTNTVITPSEKVTTDLSYKAVYTSVTKQYTVTFKSYDSSVVETQTVNYGTKVTAPAAPIKAQDNTYTYEFAGWSNGTVTLTAQQVADVEVKVNATYTAVYTPKYRDYTVIFQNEDGTELKSSTYHYSDAITAPENPTKVIVGETWNFTGWSDGTTTYAVVPTVTGNVTYKAVFTGGINVYTVTFYVDGRAYAGTYTHGQSVDFTGIDTTKAPDAQQTYTFEGWSKVENSIFAQYKTNESIPVVTESMNYYAVITPKAKTYNINWVVEGVSTPDVYVYNATIKLPPTPTKAGVEGDYGYNFLGWSTEAGNAAKIVVLNNVKVKADASYYAIFEKEVYSYTVAFRYADNNRLVCEKATYSYKASLADITHPDRATVYDDVNYKKTEYTFLGWATTLGAEVALYATSAALPLVTADVTYYAVMKPTVKDYTPVYTITFMNGTSEFAKLSVERNNTPAPAKNPVKEANDTDHYTFAGWVMNDDIGGTIYETLPIALADATYCAAYTATAHTLVYDKDASYSCSKGGTGLDVWNCTVCGKEVVKIHDADHDYVLQTASTINPSYRNNGTGYYVCSHCGLAKTEPIERLGRPVSFRVTDDKNGSVPGATVTVYYNNVAIDTSTTGADGSVTLYVPKQSGDYAVVIEAAGYKAVTGSIYVDGEGTVSTNFTPLASKYCNCTCHSNSLWSKIFRLLYKMLNSLFGVKCCECNTYL